MECFLKGEGVTHVSDASKVVNAKEEIEKCHKYKIQNEEVWCRGSVKE